MIGDLDDPKKKRRNIEAMAGKCVCPVKQDRGELEMFKQVFEGGDCVVGDAKWKEGS